MNHAASELGKLAKGIPKNFSKAELKRRKKQMTELNRERSARWAARARDGQVKGNSHQRRVANRKARRNLP